MERHRLSEEGDDHYEHHTPDEPGRAEHLQNQPIPAETERSADTETPPDPPMVFLADTGAYAAGVNRGRWLDATAEPEALQQAADELLTSSPFRDATVTVRHTHGFAGLELDGSEDLATVSRLARGIAAHGRAFAAFAGLSGNADADPATFASTYTGSWDSLAAWAEHMVSELGWREQLDAHVPPALLPHLSIDYQRLGRELSYDAQVVEDDDGTVHVFRLHP